MARLQQAENYTPQLSSSMARGGMSWTLFFTNMGYFTMRLYHAYIHYINHKQNYMKTLLQGRIQRGAQGARAPPLISIVVIFQPIILYTINPPVSDMLVPAPSTPKYIPLPI